MARHMIESAISIPNGTVTLAGTLTTPARDGSFPAAVLIAGSGPLDRDGSHKRLPLGVSKDLASILNDAGWATLRFDKRGVGESSGEYLPTGFHDELSDAVAALTWLRARPDVSLVVPVGHSVGALFAAEMSARGLAPDGAVLLACTAMTGEETLVWQAGQIGESVPQWLKTVMRLFGTSIEKQQAKALRKLKATSTDVARIQGQRINAKWMREFVVYDPDPVIRSTTSPLLAITGSKDVQVNPGDVDVIASITGDRTTGLVVDDVDHILRFESEPLSSPKRYKRQLAKPIDPRVTDALLSWLAERINAHGGVADTSA